MMCNLSRDVQEATVTGPASSTPARESTVVVAALVAAAGHLLCSPALAAQQPSTAGLRALVTAAETGEPISGAIVRVAGKAGRSAADGRVLLGGIPAGTHAVTVAATGYAPDRSMVAFEPLRVEEAAFALGPGPVLLEPVDVIVDSRSAKLEVVGFYERLEEHTGTFLPPEAVRERAGRAFRLSDLLRGVSRIRMVRVNRGRYAVRSRRGTASISRPCHPRIWLDGMLLGEWASADINSVISPSQVAAVEIYGGPAETPPQYDVTGSACGAVLIWTGARPE